MPPPFTETETQNLLRMVDEARTASDDMTFYLTSYSTHAPHSPNTLDTWIAFTLNHASLHNAVTQLRATLQPALFKAHANGGAYGTTPPGLNTALWNGVRHCNRALDLGRGVQQAIDRWWEGMNPALQVYYQTKCDRSLPRSRASGGGGEDTGVTEKSAGAA